jgi:hypothetical protein
MKNVKKTKKGKNKDKPRRDINYAQTILEICYLLDTLMYPSFRENRHEASVECITNGIRITQDFVSGRETFSNFNKAAESLSVTDPRHNMEKKVKTLLQKTMEATMQVAKGTVETELAGSLASIMEKAKEASFQFQGAI